ncbi:NAD(P)-dependent oxidoreductase [Hymenobacter glacialis]|uniref:6-phosphogluconate dehydrogenase n=1 Tax=Hymenobacter glacialis TaxID=1908236 RepID=A0A1G1SWR3_9BACT|nr:NAD(P)-dependent oxidoreductase [Hymenobacter glacialis]OGX83077.1 6-phosphogluconate dehydrogenase [Hymenobacter glacialis]
MNFNTTIGWIGLGNMGVPMVRQLLTAGYPVTVYNRHKEKEALILAEGANSAESPAAMLQVAEVVFLMVSDDQAIRDLFTGEQGLLQSPATSKLIVNMSTVSPGISREMATLCQEHKHEYLDAPVSGSVKQAETGQLAIMVGGKETAFERAKPILEKIGKLALHLGEAGAGNTAKLAMNTLLGFQAQGLAEAVLFAQQRGINTSDLLTLIQNSALASVFINTKGQVILNNNYDAAFALKLLAKDLRLAAAEGSATPLAEVVNKTFQQAEASFGDEDVMAIFKYLERA